MAPGVAKSQAKNLSGERVKMTRMVGVTKMAMAKAGVMKNGLRMSPPLFLQYPLGLRSQEQRLRDETTALSSCKLSASM